MTASGPGRRDWQPCWRQLVESMFRVHTAGGEEQLLENLSRPGPARIVGFVNAHAMNSVVHRPDFFRSLESIDLLLRDGIGVAILMRLLKQPAGLNLNGTDLIPKLLRRFAGAPIALFGTEEPFLERAREAVESRIAPGSRCVTAHGFHEDAVYLALVAEQRPALIVLGMGMPRQEGVALALRDSLEHPCLIVCGGAIIDFLGGRHTRAPGWMRRTGLEWAFRLAREPRRLFSRYVVGNPVFLLRAMVLAASAPARGVSTRPLQ